MIQRRQVALRAIEREDVPNFSRRLNDPAVIERMSFYLRLSLAQEERWFERLSRNSTSSALDFAIEHSGKQVGWHGRFGFRREVVMRDDEFEDTLPGVENQAFLSGRPIDTCVMSILEDEYRRKSESV